MTGSGISYNEGNTDTGIPAWGKIALGITGAAIAIGILAGTMGGMAAAVSVGSELLLGSLLGGVTDAAISLACGERDTNELLHDFADGAIDGFMFTGIFAPIGAAGAVSRYAKNAEGFVSKGSVSRVGYGAESGNRSKFKDVFDLADNYNLSDDTFNNHIVDRHGPNSLYSNKSHFNADFDIKNGIDSTLKGDNFIIKSNTAGRDGYIFEQTFTNPIGTNSKGKPLYTIKVVIDGFGNVVTAFPKK